MIVTAYILNDIGLFPERIVDLFKINERGCEKIKIFKNPLTNVDDF